jgi:uncharacterized membrane protein YhdT
MSFLCLGMHVFLFSSLWFTLTCITQVIFISLCGIMWKKTIQNIKEPKNEICIILFSGLKIK